MTPTRRCYVHIGLQKTGTSFLQSIFWQSAEALRGQDVTLLPGTKAGAYHLMLAVRGQLREGIDPPKAFTVLRRLPRQARRVPTAHALISQESLAGATPRQAARLVEALPGFEVHVVVTARDLARAIPSAWQQRIRSRQVESYREFLEAVVEQGPAARSFWANQDLPAVLGRWASVVPAARIHVVTVPRASADRAELLDRFAAVLGVDASVLTTGSPRHNESLGLAQAELLRRVNLALGERLPHPRKGYADMAKVFLAGQILARQPGEPVQVPQQLAEWCAARARSWVTVVRDGGYDVVGELEDLVPSAAGFAPDLPASPDVVPAAAEALASILELRRHETRELARLRGRVVELEAEVAALRVSETSPTQHRSRLRRR